MDQQTVQIQLNNTSPTFIDENRQNSALQNNQQCSELTKILIGLAILIVIVALPAFLAVTFPFSSTSIISLLLFIICYFKSTG